MTYKVITAVQSADEPVSSAEAKLQCKVDSDDTTWDAWFTANIPAAREWVEHEACRALAPQTLEMALDAFPCDSEITLDMPPVSSVTSIKYDDTNGTEQTLATSVYAFSSYGQAPRRITLKYLQVWPTTYCQADAVRIRYVTGNTPNNAKAAIMLQLELTFPNNALTDVERKTLENARDALIDTFRVYG